MFSEEQISASKVKCGQCLYGAMTKEVLDQLGYDPCERCGEDCREWEPKEDQHERR